MRAWGCPGRRVPMFVLSVAVWKGYVISRRLFGADNPVPKGVVT